MDNVVNSLKVLSDKNRLRILFLLRERKMCVCELSRVLGVTQPSVSRHLRKMRTAGLVSCEQDGLWTNYVLDPTTVSARDFLSCVVRCLSKDRQLRVDLKKARSINRAELCCPPQSKKGRK